MSAWTTSRARTFVDGFAGLPLTRTCPPSHSWVAIGRVLTRRTADNHRSIRVSSGIDGLYGALRRLAAIVGIQATLSHAGGDTSARARQGRRCGGDSLGRMVKRVGKLPPNDAEATPRALRARDGSRIAVVVVADLLESDDRGAEGGGVHASGPSCSM